MDDQHLDTSPAALAAAPAAPAAEDGAAGPRQFPAVDENAIREAFESGHYPYPRRLGRVAYEAEKAKLQAELLKVQIWAQETGQKFVILFEGRDAAGKGGTIKRFMEHLNPRYARVVALTKPSRHGEGPVVLPALHRAPADGGRDRVLRPQLVQPRRASSGSWASARPPSTWNSCARRPELERMLVRSGIRLYKYWFSVTRDEQRVRFKARETDPLKMWKLSPIDKASLDRWDDYTEAKEAMFFYTDTADAPWIIVKSNDKKRARLNCMRHFLSSVDYPGKDADVVGAYDPLIVGRAAQVLGGTTGIPETALRPSRTVISEDPPGRCRRRAVPATLRASGQGRLRRQPGREVRLRAVGVALVALAPPLAPAAGGVERGEEAEVDVHRLEQARPRRRR